MNFAQAVNWGLHSIPIPISGWFYQNPVSVPSLSFRFCENTTFLGSNIIIYNHIYNQSLFLSFSLPPSLSLPSYITESQSTPLTTLATPRVSAVNDENSSIRGSTVTTEGTRDTTGEDLLFCTMFSKILEALKQ